jgi:hypothetical protein
MKKTFKLTLILISIFFISCSKSVGKVELFPVKSGDKWGYVDREGKIIINPQFAEASAFRDGKALVKSTGEKAAYGYIDTSGKMIISPTYKLATVFNEDIAWVVSENAAPAAINEKGEIKFSLEKAQSVKLFHDGLAAFSVADSTGVESWGFVNTEGTVIIPNQFDAVGDYNEKKCAVQNKDGKFGYIDESGKIIINPQFNAASKFKNGYAIVELDNKAGVIDESGKYIINPQYSNIIIDEDIFLIELDDKWGWCDKTGKIIINPQFEDASLFGNSDLAPVQSAGKTGFVDKKGTFVINPQFDEATPFNGDLAIVVASRKIGFIDEQGKYIVNPQFDDISLDLLKYLNEESQYDVIETDFFDINSITNKVNFDLPEGINLNDNITAIITKLKISPNILDSYTDENSIYDSKKATNDASYSFSLLGELGQQSMGGYSMQLNPLANISGVKYKFYLTNKGVGKGIEIKNEFVNALSKYTKVKIGFNGYNFAEVYKDNKKYVILYGNENFIQIEILKINNELPNYIASISSQQTNEDISENVDVEEYDAEVATPVLDTTDFY